MELNGNNFVIFILRGILSMLLLSLVCNWKIFKKAGVEGWKSLVPIYNSIILVQITETSSLALFLMFTPIINCIGIFIANYMIAMNLAKKFNKSSTFGLGLFFIPFIFQLILAFGDAKYEQGTLT